ncbi:hypothetical protein RB594_004501 [Gaeumannomyces avenae]
MSAHAGLTAEFDLGDSDDGLDQPHIPYSEFINSEDIDALQAYDAQVVDQKALLTPGPNPPPPLSNSASSPESPSSTFPDSSSDSSSSKQTASSVSTKTGFAAGDEMMTDALDLNHEWKVEDLVHTDDDLNDTFAPEGTINPLSIGGQFALESSFNSTFEFNSPASTPSPFATGPSEPPPPSRQSHGVGAGPSTKAPKHGKQASPGARHSHAKGHAKGISQYSLTRSMNGLKTNGSREVSPSSNMVFSQGSSPSAVFNNSPSPTMDFMNTTNMGIASDGALFTSGFSFANGLPGTPGQHNPPALFGNHGLPMGFPGFPLCPQPVYSGATPCRLIINQTPLKSRVETQIPVKLKLSPLPPGIKRLHLPRHTISKPKLIAKPRPDRSPDTLELSVMLVCTSAMQNAELYQRACARAAAAAISPRLANRKPEGEEDETKPQEGGEVHICTGCITRERKRAARKKAKKPEEEENWTRDERRRVVVFNTHEVKEWQDANAGAPNGTQAGHFITEGVIDAPMRIACYCRHHGEKGGFRVIFTIKDHADNIIAQQLSESIMITDDHKTHTGPPASAAPTTTASSSETSLLPGTVAQSPADSATLSPGTRPFPTPHQSDPTLKRTVSVTFPSSIPPNAAQASSASASHAARNLSRPVSPNGHSGPSAKKRKSSGGMTKVPSGLAMTRLETAQSPSAAKPTGPPSQLNSALSTATSPFTPNMTSFPVSADSLFGQTPGGAPQGFNPGPLTPNSNEQALFGTANGSTRAASVDNNLAMTQLYSAPASAHPSRAPSPNNLRNSVTAMQQQQQQQQQAHLERAALANGLYSLPLQMAQPRAPLSVIHKIIPNEGPKSGGIEVTILGGGFFQGLEVMFGDQKATTTTFWGESSLVCLLPPSPISGAVLVTFKQNGQPAAQAFTSANKQQPVFKYVDDDEQQLMRTALSVLGHKMTGKIEDVRDVARRIIGGGDNPSWGSSSGGGQGPVGGGGFNGFSFNSATLESQLLKVLDLIDLDDSTHKARLNLQRRTGQTMLHLACSLGLHRFVAGLLARGANPDARDKGGYTPLHLAALNNHPEIVRRLIYAGADPIIRTLSGLTAADLSQSREVLKAIRRLERHVRSRSGGSLHSRASSATSLRSLWEPPSTKPVAKEYSTEESESTSSSGESPEYSEMATEEEGGEVVDQASDAWLDMRRPSSSPRAPDGSRQGLMQSAVAHEDPAAPPSPSAAMMALREQFSAQFQHLQQAMALHMPALPQMPNFPVMPPLSEYQGYLNSAPVFQRISSLVPNIGGGGRPDAAGERPTQDGKWWDLSSLVNSAAPPPAYEEIFPQKDQAPREMDSGLETKQASAAMAAAEAEADSKCTALYDNTAVSSEVELEDDEMEAESSMAATQQLPELLQIGRKNAITKEQQDNLRRAHAEKRKGLRSDRNLFMIWIPVLLVVLCATLYSRVPAIISAISKLLPPGDAAAGSVGRVAEQQQSITRLLQHGAERMREAM